MSDVMSNTNADTRKTKIQKKLGADACGEMEQKSKDDLRAYLASLAMDEQEIKKARADDAELTDAKDRASQLGGPYSDSLRANADRRAYAALLLDEAG